MHIALLWIVYAIVHRLRSVYEWEMILSHEMYAPILTDKKTNGTFKITNTRDTTEQQQKYT